MVALAVAGQSSCTHLGDIGLGLGFDIGLGLRFDIGLGLGSGCLTLWLLALHGRYPTQGPLSLTYGCWPYTGDTLHRDP